VKGPQPEPNDAPNPFSATEKFAPGFCPLFDPPPLSLESAQAPVDNTVSVAAKTKGES
jgi:hypothetical protein